MSFARIWQQFRRSTATLALTPGVREAWHQGRRWYHVSLLMIEDPAVQKRLEQVANALEGALLPSAPGQPHVTLWVHGFEIPHLHSLENQRVPLRIGAANSFLSCPFLEVRAPELQQLRQSFDGPEERWASYRPHLTVGRYAGALPTQQLSRRLRPFRGLPPLQTEGVLRHMCVDAFSEEGRLYPVGSVMGDYRVEGGGRHLERSHTGLDLR